ncbi:MAG: hypothetical protein R3B45_11715 [Bdellovibrionota bacterium]
MKILWSQLLFIQLLLGCQSSVDKSNKVSNTSSIDTKSVTSTLEKFKYHFFRLFNENVPFEDKALVLYEPIRDMLIPPDVNSSKDFLEGLSKKYKDFRPYMLYEEGKKNKIGKEFSEGDAIYRKPITFVLVPGVFGEFISTRPMQELFSLQDSVYSMQFKDALKKANPSDVGDRHFQLSLEKEVDLPLDKLVFATSFENSFSRKTEFQLIGLGMPEWSLESLGLNSEVADIYIRRLTKFFNIMGIPDNIVFVGYSRGAAVALEIMTKIKEKSWAENVRGVVTLGGVVFGSDLADQALIKGTKQNEQVKALEKLKKNLKELIPISKLSGFSKLKAQKDNAITIGKNTVELAKFLKVAGSTDDNDKSFDDSGSIFDSNPFQILSIVQKAIANLGLSGVIKGRYSQNIRKIKVLCEKVLQAAEELRTDKRLEWWKSHILPTHNIRYYSIVATMADPNTSPMKKDASNSLSYYPESRDYKTLLSGYQDIVEATGFYLNDSQVTVHKSMFWPKLISLLNNKQPYMDTRFLGVLGTHHWALALETVQEEASGFGNPFPRVMLMRAFARQIASDLLEN